ncbi:MAG: aldo/keto reductase [Chloroflexi bacterium]|nr:MAG: aldo/keto reductase [Chloroflexota bacterium]
MNEHSMRFGDTEVARIGLGTNRLAKTRGGVELIKAAVAAGVQMIDTAHTYTGGQSEETIGDALSPIPGNYIVATKGGLGSGRPQALRDEIEMSLTRLRTDSIPLYYLHRVDPAIPLEESIAAIKEYLDRGKIRHIGLSNVDIDQIERARKVVSIAAVQNAYSLSLRKYDTVVDYCAAEEIVFVPYVPLRGADGAAVAEIASRHRATPQQIALAWLLRRSQAILPIPGTLSLQHLKENLAALSIELSDAEFEALR